MGSELLLAIRDWSLGLIAHCLFQCQDEERTVQFQSKLKKINVPQSTKEACRKLLPSKMLLGILQVYVIRKGQRTTRYSCTPISGYGSFEPEIEHFFSKSTDVSCGYIPDFSLWSGLGSCHQLLPYTTQFNSEQNLQVEWSQIGPKTRDSCHLGFYCKSGNYSSLFMPLTSSKDATEREGFLILVIFSYLLEYFRTGAVA